jgi:hypothetical protein
MQHMRNGALTGGTIRVYVGGLLSMFNWLGMVIVLSTQSRAIISQWEHQDGHDSTASFDMVTDLPKLHAVCWSMKGWAEAKILLCWTMFLVAMCLMARASDVTEFCPLAEDIELPPRHLWDQDGKPSHIIVVLRDWKHRSEPNKGKPYKMRIWRNYMNPQYCPMFYLLKWLSFSGIKSGPIFQMPGKHGFNGKALSEDQWTGMTARLFTKVRPNLMRLIYQFTLAIIPHAVPLDVVLFVCSFTGWAIQYGHEKRVH